MYIKINIYIIDVSMYKIFVYILSKCMYNWVINGKCWVTGVLMFNLFSAIYISL